MNPEQIEAVADRLVEYLFIDGEGNESQRLVLEVKNKPLHGSGWCRDAVKNHIVQALSEVEGNR